MEQVYFHPDRGGSPLRVYHSLLVGVTLNFIVTPKQGWGWNKRKNVHPFRISSCGSNWALQSGKGNSECGWGAVSYTHLDVYKRQQYGSGVLFCWFTLLMKFTPPGMTINAEVI